MDEIRNLAPESGMEQLAETPVVDETNLEEVRGNRMETTNLAEKTLEECDMEDLEEQTKREKLQSSIRKKTENEIEAKKGK